MIKELSRFGSAAVLNTIFGYGTYAFFIWLGVNMYLSQILSQVLGAMFNARTYRIAFRSMTTSRVRFVLTYILNYALGVAFLTIYGHLLGSAYIAGLLTLITCSAINFLLLRNFVFAHRTTPI